MTTVAGNVLDAKLRDARRLARERIKEAEKLLKRAGKHAAGETQVSVRKAIDATTEVLKGNNVDEIHATADRLGDAVDKNLQAYRKPPWRESLESILVAIMVALLLRSFVVEAFKIPSGSMIPTLAIGDQIFVNKYIYGLRVPFTSIRVVRFAEPKRGEVIVFIFPNDPREDYIKRVIAVGGDTVEVRNGVVIVNDQPVARRRLGSMTVSDRDGRSDRWYPLHVTAYEETLEGKTFTVIEDDAELRSAENYPKTTVPAGHVFVMGDNRDHSQDSRYWGFVPEQNILGRSLFVWWSWGERGLALDRLGTWID